VDAAARLLRERGADGVSVDELMHAAGLTRGGFYAHFPDKTALLASALDHAFAEQRARLFGTDDGTRGAELRKRAVQRYLSREHIEHPGLGCPAAALATEMGRADPVVRAVFERNIKRVIGLFSVRGEMSTEQAMILCALAVGAVTLARGLDDTRYADEILAAARHHLVGLEAPTDKAVQSRARPKAAGKNKTRRRRAP
jgi:TetR/AcrR family transcriptional repressor of nem operon